MRILLTGSTGVIGRALYEKLSSDNEVIKLFRGQDLSVYNNIGLDCIINCAAEVDNIEKMVDSNLGLTVSLLNLARRVNCKMIQIGSSSETGPTDLPRSPDSPCRPSNLYEATKLAATNMCLGYAGEYGVKVSVSRPFTVYCRDDKPRKMLQTLLQAHKLGVIFNCYPGSHDWIHLDDFVSGIIALLAANPDLTMGKIYHFGTGVSTSNSSVVSLFESVVGDKVHVRYHYGIKYRTYDISNWCADWSLSKRDLGWEPKISLKRGLEMIVREGL